MSDTVTFTPIASLVGGVLIGTATALLAIVSSRVAGVSGIAAGMASSPDRAWRGVFLLGLVIPAAIAAVTGLVSFDAWSIDPTTLVVGGLLVGVGTRLANGCTSGHGVAGLARLSPRSLVATTTFVLVGMATVTWLGTPGGLPWETP